MAVTAITCRMEVWVVGSRTLASALADAIRRRGVADPAASLAAEAGIAVFKVAFERWTGDASSRPLSHLIRQSADQLKAVTTGQQPPPRR
jgi:hypothetical protein